MSHGKIRSREDGNGKNNLSNPRSGRRRLYAGGRQSEKGVGEGVGRWERGKELKT